MASPPTVMDVHGAAHEPVNPPGDEVAVYEMIGEPPLLAGARKATVACASPRVAPALDGAPGTVTGVALFDGADGAPVPSAFVAVTVNV